MRVEPDAPVPFRQFTYKRTITGVPVYVSSRYEDDRNMVLEDMFSRVLLTNEIHEILLTGERTRFPGTVRNIAYVGFFEITQGGTLRVGDRLWLNDELAGEFLGFDLCHYPNHFNLIFWAQHPQSGSDLGLGADTPLRLTA